MSSLRWQTEINFRDIKTTLGLDVLHTQTPAMLKKEIHLQAIVYNLVRLLMSEASRPQELRQSASTFDCGI